MPSVRGFDVLRQTVDAPPRHQRTPVQERMRREAIELARTENLVDAAYSYRIVALEGPAGDLLCVDGEKLPAPWLIPETGELTGVACGVCTIGARIVSRVGELFAERRRSLALALDSLANELLFAVVRRAQDRMFADAKKAGLTMAGELRAGDPGLALEAQSTVLRLAEAENVGVSLTRGAMMHPVKSASMVLGVGLALPKTEWSRCDHCPSRERCAVV